MMRSAPTDVECNGFLWAEVWSGRRRVDTPWLPLHRNMLQDLRLQRSERLLPSSTSALDLHIPCRRFPQQIIVLLTGKGAH